MEWTKEHEAAQEEAMTEIEAMGAEVESPFQVWLVMAKNHPELMEDDPFSEMVPLKENP